MQLIRGVAETLGADPQLEERNLDTSDGSLFELIAGTRELLRHFRATGKKVGLVSTMTLLAMDAMLDSNELRLFVDFSICGDEVSNYKPHPEEIFES